MADRYLLASFFLAEPLLELEALAEPGWHLVAPRLPETAVQGRMTVVHRALAAKVAEAVGEGHRPVAVAGDCCAAIGMAAGLRRAGIDPTLLWLDAHGDFNTWDTTPSGFLGGMPLAMLVGLGDPTLAQGVELEAWPQERVVLSDARDLDPGERILLEDSAVVHLNDPRALADYRFPDGPLWIHFDVDVADPADVPAVLYPAPGGLAAAELAEIFRHLAAQRQIAAVTLSTWSPKLDADGRTRAVCLDLLQALLA